MPLNPPQTPTAYNQAEDMLVRLRTILNDSFAGLTISCAYA